MKRFDNFYFSDEMRFALDGYINSQTYCVWLSENPRAYIDKGLHPAKIGVWYSISRKRIIGPIFFTTIVDSNAYCNIIYQFITLLNEDERYIYFEQNGARAHTSKQTWHFYMNFSMTVTFPLGYGLTKPRPKPAEFFPVGPFKKIRFLPLLQPPSKS